MFTVTFTVMGDVVLARALTRFGEGVRDVTPAWERIRDDFFRIENEQFDSQGARGGMPWLALSPNYAAWKERYFPGQPILELRGTLRFEMTGGLQTEIQPLRLSMTPLVPYAKFHQRGTSRMPPRPVVSLTEADKMGWVKMIQQHLVERATEAGLR